jgi:hypothetical protein
LGFVAEDLNLFTLDAGDNMTYSVNGSGKSLLGKLFNKTEPKLKYCKNQEAGVCNWVLPADSPDTFCRACELNHIVPNLSNPEHVRQWGLIEGAKHRLIYSLLQMKLPLVSKFKDEEKGLSFNFLSEADAMQKVMTGHENGMITLNVNEADDDKRELLRNEMNEPYRTLLGHFRHEVGHYYWDRLIDNSQFIDEYRQVFGDEREDYDQALQRHYNQGAPVDWNINFISEYASTHPWEDWAETWAHYMHIMDTLETADAFGMSVAPRIATKSDHANAMVKTDPYEQQNFKQLLDIWLPITFAINSMNRSMGNHDLYPFVIQPKVVEKLTFIHKVCYASKVN